MVFGNWLVTKDRILWNAEGVKHFEIAADNLNRILHSRVGNSFYEAILLATNEDWLTEDDLYDLNFAFVYAIAKFNLEFDYQVFDATLAEQYEQFEDEEDDEEEI